jgi:formylglycine-generating enzyme required for sulfatase activity
MVIVQGGALPVGSAFAGQEVAPFHIGRFETTWGEWKTVRTWATANGYDIGTVGEGSADNHPVRNVNWYDSLKWLNAKSEMEGLMPVYSVNGTIYQVGQSIPGQSNSANGYRLPSEKEWEWAARGGVSSQGYTYSGSNISSSVAWDNSNSSGGTNTVGTKAANELGIYDMSGNVWEYCWDVSSINSSYRVFRGGSWDNPTNYNAVGDRGFYGLEGIYSTNGLRYARNAIGDMVTVQGGTLPSGSGLAGQTVQTFQIGRTEVTWAEWQTVRTYAIANGYDLTGIGNGTASTHPVQNVNWYDVLKWCNAKSQMEGLTPVYTVNGTVFKTGQNVPNQTTISNGYRLPIEIEWEWAARGGVSSKGYSYSGNNDINAVAWYASNSSGATKAVGAKSANELGIYDMSGNVWEWCQDVASTSFRRIRGGSWYNTADYCVVRGLNTPGDRLPLGGFRLARNQQLVLSVSAIGASQSRLGDAFNYGLNTTGGVGPYTYQIVSGSLPQGLQLTSDGRIIGTSQAAGAFTITMRVTDSLGNTKLIQITITIDPASSNPSIALGAGIDSGGGLTSIGQLNNWSSIGSPMDTTSATAGTARITPGLLRMLLQLQTQ